MRDAASARDSLSGSIAAAQRRRRGAARARGVLLAEPPRRLDAGASTIELWPDRLVIQPQGLLQRLLRRRGRLVLRFQAIEQVTPLAWGAGLVITTTAGRVHTLLLGSAQAEIAELLQRVRADTP